MATRLDRVFLHHLARAQGSLAEMRYYLILARDLSYLDSDVHASAAEQAEEVSKILTSFRKQVERRCQSGPSRSPSPDP